VLEELLLGGVQDTESVSLGRGDRRRDNLHCEENYFNRCHSKRITNEGFGSLKAIKELPDPFRSVFNVDFVDFNLNNPRYQ
jgi:hypothetical protein